METILRLSVSWLRCRGGGIIATDIVERVELSKRVFITLSM
jgi:hypothetical protein